MYYTYTVPATTGEKNLHLAPHPSPSKNSKLRTGRDINSLTRWCMRWIEKNCGDGKKWETWNKQVYLYSLRADQNCVPHSSIPRLHPHRSLWLCTSLNFNAKDGAYCNSLPTSICHLRFISSITCVIHFWVFCLDWESLGTTLRSLMAPSRRLIIIWVRSLQMKLLPLSILSWWNYKTILTPLEGLLTKAIVREES